MPTECRLPGPYPAVLCVLALQQLVLAEPRVIERGVPHNLPVNGLLGPKVTALHRGLVPEARLQVRGVTFYQDVRSRRIARFC